MTAVNKPSALVIPNFGNFDSVELLPGRAGRRQEGLGVP